MPEAPIEAGKAAGSFVAFFAAQTNAVTPEMNLPQDKPSTRVAVLPNTVRPDAIWVLPAARLINDLATTLSVATADTDAQALRETSADTLGMALGTGGPDKNSLTVVKAAVGARGSGAYSDAQRYGGAGGCECAVFRRRLRDQPLVSARLQQGDRLNNDVFKFGDTALTPALPQSPVQDLSFLAQEVRDTSRGVRGPGRVSALAESDASGPAPGIIQLELPLELRTVAAH